MNLPIPQFEEELNFNPPIIKKLIVINHCHRGIIWLKVKARLPKTVGKRSFDGSDYY